MATESPPAGTKYCSACGSEINAEAEICPECGVPQEDATSEPSTPEPMGRVMAAVVGGIVGLFLGWIPLLGPIISGFTGGFLRGSNVKESALTGFLANVLTSIPAALLVVLFLVLGTFGAIAEGSGEAGLGLFVWLLIFLVSFVSFYAFGALGGVLGAKVTSRGDPTTE